MTGIRVAVSACLLAALALSTALARAQGAASGPRLSIPARGDQPALSLELAEDGLWAAACQQNECAARAGQHLALPAEVLAARKGATLLAHEPWPGRSLAHVRVPLANGAWEALVAAAPGKLEPRFLFAGHTGARLGEEGERRGERVWIRGAPGDVRVLVGEVREDVELCGRPTLLDARLVDRDLVLRPAKVQQLSPEERRSAAVLVATPRPSGPTPGGNALRVLAASSSQGDPLALTDGRVETRWSEARGGTGRGEFVVLRPLPGAGLAGLEFLMRGEGSAHPDGAAPRVVWWVTRDSVYRIDFPDDGWQRPGVWYELRFPAVLHSDCAALVLEQGHARGPDADVGLAELRGISELSALSPTELAGRLSTPGDAGAAAVPALLQAGDAGVAAVISAFGALDGLGRVRALDVLARAPCEATAGIYAELLLADDTPLARRAERRLESCGPSASAALRSAFEASTAEHGVPLARTLAVIAPELAVELVGVRLASVAREHRSPYREIVSRLAGEPRAEAGLRRLLDGGALGLAAEVQALRALGAELPRFRPEASRALGRALAAARTFEDRYLLLPPAAALAPSEPVAGRWLAASLRDADEYLRAAAARVMPNEPALAQGLLAAVVDPAVRVREASVVRLGELQHPAAAAHLTERLAGDAWPLVRAAAARALAGVPSATVELDRALGEATSDASASVRIAALRSLGRRGARTQASLVTERFVDTSEDAHVRAAAATALGELCDAGALDALVDAARRLLDERPGPDDVVVGTAALNALGRLAPARGLRLEAAFSEGRRRPGLDALIERAQHRPDRCLAVRDPIAPRPRARRRPGAS